MPHAAGTAFVDSTGKRQLDSTGKRMLGNGTSDSCCCAEGPDPDCEFCSKVATETVTVSFSGVTMCTMCHDDGSIGPASQKVLSGALDGTYELTRESACEWGVLVSPGITIRTSINADCGVEFGDQVDHDGLQIRLTMTGADSGRIYAAVSDGSDFRYLFYATFSGYDCRTAKSGIANANTVCGRADSRTQLGYDGTVDLTPDV